MSKVKIELPEVFPFQTEIPLRISDINYGGHLGNDAVLSLAHEARLRWLNELGYSEMEIGDGLGLIMANAMVVYRSEGRWGDRLKIFMAAGDFAGSRFTFYYRIARTDNDCEIARICTGMSAFDYQLGKPRPVPEEFQQKFR